MERIWAPWRMDYILGDKDKECVFCIGPEEKDDKEKLIIARGKYCFVILNKYPYNNGHLMVTPYRHVSELTLLNDPELLEIMQFTQHSLKVFKKTMRPGGFNIGINTGITGGAGIKDHIHLHVVPRWEGDTNFMPVIGCTKIMPQHLQDTYNILKEAWRDQIV